MPRRKTLTLDLDALECGDKIYQLLYDCDELIDYDLSTLKITVQEEIENKIKDIDKVIRNLERYMAINPNYSDVENGNNLVKKQTLAKMLGVSRVTLNKWFRDGLLYRESYHTPGTLKAVDPIDILEQLKKYNSFTKTEK
ncbi:MAG: hypothetical protein SNG27_09235 [Rikenellaceae bacterium]